MILEILSVPNEILSTIAEPVNEKTLLDDHETQMFIDDMVDTWRSMPGAMGLAANQVGKPIQIFIYADKGEPNVVINPKLIASSGKCTSHAEGCLSVPHRRFEVKRKKQVVITGIDRMGREMRIKSRNKLQAIILQHELDHLMGMTVEERGKEID